MMESSFSTSTSYRDFESPLPGINWDEVGSNPSPSTLSLWLYVLGHHDWRNGAGYPPPIKYERIYRDSPERSAWLSALKTLLQVANPILCDLENIVSGSFFKNLPFETDWWQKQQILGNCFCATGGLGDWLVNRQKSADLQIIDNICCVYSIVDHCEVEGASAVFAIDLFRDFDEHERFLIAFKLFEEQVQQGLVSTTSLQVLSHRLEEIIQFPLKELLAKADGWQDDFDVAEVVYSYPVLAWKNIGDYQIPTKIIDGFWASFAAAMSLKIKWATQVQKLVSALLGLKTAASIPVSDLATGQKSLLSAQTEKLNEALSSSLMPRHRLDQFLLDISMIRLDPEFGCYRAVSGAKPYMWANVRAALTETLLISVSDDKDAAGIFSQAYGAVVSKGTMEQRPQKGATKRDNKARFQHYANVLDRLKEFIGNVKS